MFGFRRSDKPGSNSSAGGSPTKYELITQEFARVLRDRGHNAVVIKEDEPDRYRIEVPDDPKLSTFYPDGAISYLWNSPAHEWRAHLEERIDHLLSVQTAVGSFPDASRWPSLLETRLMPSDNFPGTTPLHRPFFDDLVVALVLREGEVLRPLVEDDIDNTPMSREELFAAGQANADAAPSAKSSKLTSTRGGSRANSRAPAQRSSIFLRLWRHTSLPPRAPYWCQPPLATASSFP